MLAIPNARGIEILVFGGNGFIGSSTVEQIMEREPEATVTLVSRGNWYWDSLTRIRPRVEQLIKCDREQTLSDCTELVEYIASVNKFDTVIDLSAYSGKAVKESSELLKGKVDLYVLISTDSVYDACEKHHDGFSKEEDCVRPETDEEKEQLNKFYDYAHRKLQTEEAIVDQRLQEGGLNFVILRLPDVVGPRDGTYRWWIYQLWAKLSKYMPDTPVKIPSFLENYPMSFVYVEDVAKTIVDLLNAPPQVRDQIINLAWSETFTSEQLITHIEDALGIENKHIIDEDRENQFYMYPSVRKGPIDVTKAESLLGWKTTPWEDVVKVTVEFYEQAMTGTDFLTQRDEIIQVLASTLFENDVDKRKELYTAIEKSYDINLNHFHAAHDEL